MAFYGSEIIYDGVPSSFYDLRISDFSTNSGEADSPTGSDIEIFEKRIYRKPKSFYFGRSLTTPLEFDLTLTSSNVIDGSTRNAIQKLFLARQGYLPLQIVQDDIADAVFYTMFTGATNKYVGNVHRGIVLHGKCDSPWGRTFPKTFTRSFSGNNVVDYDFEFYNDSADSEYLYPKIEFTLNTVGSSFILTNITDDNRQFIFTDVQPNETITIDNYRETVESDTVGLLRLSNFNKNWFRLLPENNELNVKAGIGSFTITYSLTRNIGV